jgi:hypothetical protein
LTFTTEIISDVFNDKLLPITSDALFHVVNMRVAREAINALEAYRGSPSIGYYPFANIYGSGPPYCNSGQNRGRFPLTPEACLQAPWNTAAFMAPDGWFYKNAWNLVTHYAISKSCGQLSAGLTSLGIGTLLCGLATNIPLLSQWPLNFLLALAGLSFTDDPVSVSGVTNANGARALVIVTGRALTPGQNHTPACASDDHCMEDGPNTDTETDAVYVKPSLFPNSNDRMVLCDGIGCPRTP